MNYSFSRDCANTLDQMSCIRSAEGRCAHLARRGSLVCYHRSQAKHAPRAAIWRISSPTASDMACSPKDLVRVALTAISRGCNNSFGFEGISGLLEIFEEISAHDPKETLMRGGHVRWWPARRERRSPRAWVAPRRAAKAPATLTSAEWWGLWIRGRGASDHVSGASSGPPL